MPKFPKISLYNLQYLQKGMGDEVHFWPEDKPNSFLQGDSVTLRVQNQACPRWYCQNGDIIILMGMIKNSQSTQSKKFSISLQFLKKEVRNIFCMQIYENQSSYKLVWLFLTELTRPVQSNQNRNLVIFLQYIKKIVSQLLLCSILMQNI